MKKKMKMQIGAKPILGQTFNHTTYLNKSTVHVNNWNATVQLQTVTRISYTMPHHLTLNGVCDNLTGGTTLMQ